MSEVVDLPEWKHSDFNLLQMKASTVPTIYCDMPGAINSLKSASIDEMLTCFLEDEKNFEDMNVSSSGLDLRAVVQFSAYTNRRTGRRYADLVGLSRVMCQSKQEHNGFEIDERCGCSNTGCDNSSWCGRHYDNGDCNNNINNNGSGDYNSSRRDNGKTPLSMLRPDGNKWTLVPCSTLNSNINKGGCQNFEDWPGNLGMGKGVYLETPHIDFLICMARSGQSRDEILSRCEAALLAADVNNVTESYLIAAKYGLTNIMDSLIELIRENFILVSQTKQFLELPVDLMEWQQAVPSRRYLLGLCQTVTAGCTVTSLFARSVSNSDRRLYRHVVVCLVCVKQWPQAVSSRRCLLGLCQTVTAGCSVTSLFAWSVSNSVHKFAHPDSFNELETTAFSA
ncbi:hypothetical protein RRG08_037459 [Elysia crispata]|uniref:Uncharacterized protein n=1 Tax=Elysia crispata TaxID=231223 RepID=A0AAE1E8E5_9GAST|nr:hypothetical protein RRG08_037459 [Elysia crispata]